MHVVCLILEYFPLAQSSTDCTDMDWVWGKRIGLQLGEVSSLPSTRALQFLDFVH